MGCCSAHGGRANQESGRALWLNISGQPTSQRCCLQHRPTSRFLRAGNSKSLVTADQSSGNPATALSLVHSTSSRRSDPRLTQPPSPRPAPPPRPGTRRQHASAHPAPLAPLWASPRHTLCPRRTRLGDAPSRTHPLPARCPSASCVRRRHLAAPRPSRVLNPRRCGSPRDAPAWSAPLTRRPSHSRVALELVG